MRKKRITGRFYLFLLAILVVAFLIARPHFSFGEREALIVSASSAYTKKMDAVILRSERVVSSGTVARVEYVATEGALLSEGDTIAYLYSTGYSESELVKLESIRQNIQAYHKSTLNNIVDADLNRLNRIVDMKALELKSLVTHKTAGNLLDLTRQLEGAMVNRQEYMRSNKREDPKLNKLYNDENTRLNSIASWRTVARADSQGVISFYMDGYESTLSPENLDALTAAELRAVLSGAAHAGEASRLTDIYRLVDQNEWYVVILTDGASWNPVLDQQYSLQFEGFEDIAYTAKVTRVKKSDGEVMAVFQVTAPIGPLLYQRTGKAYMSITLTGLAVKSEAIYSQNGQTGVWLYDVPGGTFVSVTVLSSDGKTALIEPTVAGALTTGQRVLLK